MITVTETPSAAPAEFIDYSPVYLVQPSDLLSTVPLRIVVPWANKDGQVAAALAIYRANDPNGPFAKVTDSYVNAGFMQGSVKELGYFFSGAPKPPISSAAPRRHPRPPERVHSRRLQIGFHVRQTAFDKRAFAAMGQRAMARLEMVAVAHNAKAGKRRPDRHRRDRMRERRSHRNAPVAQGRERTSMRAPTATTPASTTFQ